MVECNAVERRSPVGGLAHRTLSNTASEIRPKTSGTRSAAMKEPQLAASAKTETMNAVEGGMGTAPPFGLL